MKYCWTLIKKIYLTLPLLLLLSGIYIPFVENLFFRSTEMLDNRNLHTRPTKLTPQFAQEFTDYYNDTFANRKKMIVKYVKLKQKLKIDTGQYFYGKNDWMFYDSAKVNNGNSLIGYYGEARLGDNDLRELEESLLKEKEFFEQYGAQYLLLVIPDKENVYSEFMPENMQKMRVSDEALSDVALAYIQDNRKVNVLGIKKNLLEAKKKSPYPIYYSKDTHWNSIGAYIGFRTLMQKLNPDFEVPALSNMAIQERGLIGQDMHPTDKDMAYEVRYLPEMHAQKVKEIENQITVYENKQAPLSQTVLVAGDSFFWGLQIYLTKVYQRVVFVGGGSKSKDYYQRALDEYKPDIVVHELIERYFQALQFRGKVFSGEAE